MYTVGELKDPKMAQEIVAGLMDEKNIKAESSYDLKNDLYFIYVFEEQFLPIATDYYRVKLGINKPIELDQEWVKIKSIPMGIFTLRMIQFSIALYLFSFSNMGQKIYQLLFIGTVENTFLAEVFAGQVWRLLSPIFLHMSFLHLLFNMLWFKDLSSLIEHHFGNNFLLLFIFITGLCSNLLQYSVNGPMFGGMSGVLYGMLGFIWVYKKINPHFEYALPRFDIGMMIGWFFLCLTGVLGPIANTAHGIGLVAGILMAAFYKFKWSKLGLKYSLLALGILIFTLGIEGYKLNGRYFLWQWLK